MNNSGVVGKYKLVVHKGNPEEPTQVVDWFDNLITNQGLDSLGFRTDGRNFYYCKVGSGSTTPAVTDVGLVNVLGSKNNSTDTHGFTTTAPFYSWRRMEYVFTPGQVTGNVSEISVGWDETNASAFSRALVTENGSPITITVLPDDYLTVYYEFRLYPNLSDATGTVTIGGTTHSFTGRAAGVGTTSWTGYWAGHNPVGSLDSVQCHDGGIGTVFSGITSTEYSHLNSYEILVSGSVYILGTYYRDVTFTIPVGLGNLTNFIKSLLLVTREGAFQYEFTPAIQKTINNSLTLTFRFSWGRYTP